MANEVGLVVAGTPISRRISGAVGGRTAVRADTAAINADHGERRDDGMDSIWELPDETGCGIRGGLAERVFQLDARITDGLQPVRAILPQAPSKQPRDAVRDRRQLPPVRLALEHAREDLAGRIAIECAASAEHLVEHASECPDISRRCPPRFP